MGHAGVERLGGGVQSGHGKELWRTKGTMGGVFALAVSPDEMKLAGLPRPYVRIWDAKTGAHASPVIHVAISPDGKHVISTGQIGSLCI